MILFFLVNCQIMQKKFDAKHFHILPPGGALQRKEEITCVLERHLVVKFENLQIKIFLHYLIVDQNQQNYDLLALNCNFGQISGVIHFPLLHHCRPEQKFGSSSFFTSISIDRVELQIEQNYSRGIDRGRIAFDRDDIDRYAQKNCISIYHIIFLSKTTISIIYTSALTLT